MSMVDEVMNRTVRDHLPSDFLDDYDSMSDDERAAYNARTRRWARRMRHAEIRHRNLWDNVRHPRIITRAESVMMRRERDMTA